MLDLEPRYLEMVKQILATHAKDKTVWAYGSRIKGGAHSGSDLDLVIFDKAEGFKPESLIALKAAFTDSNLPILVDVFNWSELPESFNKEEIQEMHEVLQESGEAKSISLS